MKFGLLSITVLSITLQQVTAPSYRDYDCAAVETENSKADGSATIDSSTGAPEHFEKTILAAISAESLRQKRAELYYCLAAHHHTNGDLVSAESFYGKSIQESGDNPWPHVSRGLLYTEKHEFDKALNDFATATQLDGTIGVAYFYKAEANYRLKNYAEALEDLRVERTIRNDAPSLASSILTGDIYFGSKDYENAIDSYQESLQIVSELAPWAQGNGPRIFPKELEIYRKLITTYCISGQNKLARRSYKELLAKNEQGAELSGLRCW